MGQTTTLQTAASAKPAISAASFAHMVKDGVGAATNDAAKASASFASTHPATAQTAGLPPTLWTDSSRTVKAGIGELRGRDVYGTHQWWCSWPDLECQVPLMADWPATVATA